MVSYSTDPVMEYCRFTLLLDSSTGKDLVLTGGGSFFKFISIAKSSDRREQDTASSSFDDWLWLGWQCTRGLASIASAGNLNSSQYVHNQGVLK